MEWLTEGMYEILNDAIVEVCKLNDGLMEMEQTNDGQIKQENEGMME